MLLLTADIWFTVKDLSKWGEGHPLLGDHFKISQLKETDL